jgi:16S rRNA (adenine1518-N6/adenine1519-N6)-dimethyltransferase
MQTKQQIQRLLASAGVRPNKRLGQHFLIDLNLIEKLVNFAYISNGDIVLEVGCGTGSLTQALAEKACRVIAVELDEAVAEIAERELSKAENVKVINADVLESKHTINRTVTDSIESARKSCAGRFLLVANLPYRVASPLMMNLITGNVRADGMYVTVQKEVAERMTAAPGSDDYGTLSIFLAATGDVKTVRTLKPTVFWPQPQVDSAMISFVRSEEKVSQIKHLEFFSEVVNLFMGHRRKMLKACSKLATGKLIEISNWSQIFEQSCVDPQNRPEQLSPEDYIAIANLCHERLNVRG